MRAETVSGRERPVGALQRQEPIGVNGFEARVQPLASGRNQARKMKARKLIGHDGAGLLRQGCEQIVAGSGFGLDVRQVANAGRGKLGLVVRHALDDELMHRALSLVVAAVRAEA